MNTYSRALRYIDMKDVKQKHQQKIIEQKIQEEKYLEEKKKKNIEEAAAKPFKSNWRSTLTENEWIAISGSGPTNSTSQTFGYYVGGELQTNFETGEPITYTVSGLGGIESVPTTTTIDYGFGDVSTVDAPTYNQLAMQGYAKPLGFNVNRRTDFQDVNPYLDASQEFAQKVGADYMMNARVQQTIRQEVETDITKIAAKFDSSLIENMGQNIKLAVEAIMNGQQPPLVAPPDPPFTGMSYEQMVDEQNKVNDKYNDLLAPLYKELDSYAGQLAPAGLVAKINALVEKQSQETNALYEKYSKYNQEYGDLLAKRADEWGKFVNAIEDYRKGFNFKSPAPITTDDENFISSLEGLPKGVNNVMSGWGFAGDMALRYAKGDYTPVTKSPGYNFDNQVLNLIQRAQGYKNVSPNSVQDPVYADAMTGVMDLPVRLALGNFNYEVTPQGIRVYDTFNFNKNTSVGAGKLIPGLQNTADRLVDIGNKRARALGFDPDDDNFGIKIDYIIPKRRLNKRQRKQLYGESTTWDRTKKHLKGA